MMAGLPASKDNRRGAAGCRAASESDPSLQSVEERPVKEDSPDAAEGTQTSPDVLSRDQALSEDPRSSPESPGYLQPGHSDSLNFSVDSDSDDDEGRVAGAAAVAGDPRLPFPKVLCLQTDELTDSSFPQLDQELLLEPREEPSNPGSASRLEVWQSKWHRDQVLCSAGWQSKWHRDQVVALSRQQFDGLVAEFPEFHRCKSDLAAFVLQREVLDTAGGPCQHYAVVALGSGQSSVDQWLCYSGLMVQDCRAIAIARRALQRYLYKQLLLYHTANPKSRDASIFESSPDCTQLRLKPKTHLHLFCNQPPDTAAKNFSYQGRWAQALQYRARGLQVPAPCLDPSIWGAQVCCVSPSAKLFRWGAIGLQGALLSHLVQPIYVDTLVLGGLYGSKFPSTEKVSEWINRRLGENWKRRLPAPYRKRDILVQSGDCVMPVSPKESLSLNWCAGDAAVEVLDGDTGYIIDGSPSLSGPGFSSRLCKRALYTYFVRAVRHGGGHPHLLQLPTYRHVKAEAELYQRAKNVVSQQFLFNEVGPWKSKHLVDCFRL